MKNPAKQGRAVSLHHRITIRTTILDLIRSVSELTKDDRLVVAAVSHLLNSGRVRSARSLLPVRVVATHQPRAPRYRPGARNRQNRLSGCMQ